MSYFHIRCTSLPKKTFEDVIKSWNDAIIQLKWNQPNLNKNCKKIVDSNKSIWEDETFNKWRNREETRNTKVYKYENLIPWLTNEWWKNIKYVVLIHRKVKEKNTKTKKYDYREEKSFYLATKKFTAKEYWEIIRWHWWIENRNHHVKDVSFNEDASRIRKNADIFVRLRSFALNIMRVYWDEFIKSNLYENALSFDNMITKYWYLF